MRKDKEAVQTGALLDHCSLIVLLFLFFCISGWVYEVALGFLYEYGFENRGFLHGPYLPVYGFGILILMISLKKLMDKRYKIGKLLLTPLIVFLTIVVLTTGIEYLTGSLMERIFHRRFWDYSGYNYNLHGRICLSASLRFGIGGMVFLYLLIPLCTKFILRIPPKIRHWLALAVVVLLCTDTAVTLLYTY